MDLGHKERGLNMATKYPDIEVQLSGESDNAFSIIGRVRKALRRAGVAEKEIEAFTKDAKGDYDHVLQTCMKWVTWH